MTSANKNENTFVKIEDLKSILEVKIKRGFKKKSKKLLELDIFQKWILK